MENFKSIAVDVRDVKLDHELDKLKKLAERIDAECHKLQEEGYTILAINTYERWTTGAIITGVRLPYAEGTK